MATVCKTVCNLDTHIENNRYYKAYTWGVWEEVNIVSISSSILSFDLRAEMNSS